MRQATADMVAATLSAGQPSAVATPTSPGKQVTRPPSPTLTPSLTPTPSATATPTPLPTPTLEPEERLTLAKRALEDGDYPAAISLWQDALALASPPQRPALSLALALAYSQEGKHREAAALLMRVLSETTATADLAQATGLLGSAYEALGDWRAAAGAYERLLELEQTLGSETRWRLARAYQALGENDKAAQHLGAIDLASLAPARQAEILEELATVRRKLKDYDGALATYQRILDFAARAEYRALILLRQGETQREATRADKAVEVLQRVLREYPASAAAYPALVALDELHAATVSDLERGELLYRGERYADAVKMLERYILARPDGALARAHYTAGLAHERLKQYGEAFQQFDVVIERYPQDALAPEAWLAKARAARAYGGEPSGLYREFALRYPAHPRAPEALWLAAQALEREGAWQQAASFYRLLRTQYATDKRAPEAAFREGLAAYAQRDAATALKQWGEALQTMPAAEERARLLTWYGLAARTAGDTATAHEYWRAATVAAPGSYYSLRARDLEAGTPVTLSAKIVTVLPGARLSETDWDQIANWMRGWLQTNAEAGAGVREDPLARRGAMALRLGWWAEALAAYSALRDKLAGSPEGSLALARIVEEAGLHALALSCAEQLTALGRRAGVEPHRALLRLSYPTAYGHLVSAEAEQQQVDALLFLALMRQESRFDPQARSYAGATGLTQVMPDTGQWIAGKLGTPNYRYELLLRPVVSVHYGVWYLSQTLSQRKGDWIAALVAYNAGPGTLERWTNGQPISDHDLFYETIAYTQTKDYVRTIYQQYRTYQDVYRRPTPEQPLSP